MLRNVADKREEIGEELLQDILPDLEKSNIKLRPQLELLIGGIYYLSLHSKSNGSTFCGIDINTQEGKEQVDNTIQEFVFETYEKLK